jgi:hypothetical protein
LWWSAGSLECRGAAMGICQGIFCVTLISVLSLADGAAAFEHPGGLPGAVPSHHLHTPRYAWATSQIENNSASSSTTDSSSDGNAHASADGPDAHTLAIGDPVPLSYPTSYLEEVVQKLGFKGGHMDFIPFGQSESSNFGWGLGRAKGPGHHTMLLLQWGLP